MKKTTILLMIIFVGLLIGCSKNTNSSSEIEYPYLSIEYTYNSEGYYSVKMVTTIVESGSIDSDYVWDCIEISSTYDDGVHGEHAVETILSKAFRISSQKVVLPASIKHLEPFAFYEGTIDEINFESVEYISNFAFANVIFNCDLHFDSLAYAEDFAFCYDYGFSEKINVYYKMNNEGVHKIYIGSSETNPSLPMVALPVNVYLAIDFVPREVIFSTSLSYFSEIADLHYAGTEAEFYERMSSIDEESYNLVRPVFNVSQ